MNLGFRRCLTPARKDSVQSKQASGQMTRSSAQGDAIPRFPFRFPFHVPVSRSKMAVGMSQADKPIDWSETVALFLKKLLKAGNSTRSRWPPCNGNRRLGWLFLFHRRPGFSRSASGSYNSHCFVADLPTGPRSFKYPTDTPGRGLAALGSFRSLRFRFQFSCYSRHQMERDEQTRSDSTGKRGGRTQGAGER